MKKATAGFQGCVVLLFLLLVPAAMAAPQLYPPWFPQSLFTINPDNTTVEDFGTDTFHVGKGDDAQTIEVKGHHWSGSLYPPAAGDAVIAVKSPQQRGLTRPVVPVNNPAVTRTNLK